MQYHIIKATYDAAEQLAHKLRKLLVNHQEVAENFNFLFVIGGDGTFAQAVRMYANVPKLKIIGIHGGNLGFFASFCETNLSDLLSLINDPDHPCFKQFHLLSLKINEHNYYAFNDIVLFGQSILDANIQIDNYHLEHYRGSGLIFSTKCGSTGFNKSALGPIIFPQVQCYLMHELYPQISAKSSSLINPLILPLSSWINIQRNEVWKRIRISLDGQELLTEWTDQTLTIQLIASQAQIFLPCDSKSYIESLKRSFLTTTH